MSSPVTPDSVLQRALTRFEAGLSGQQRRYFQNCTTLNDVEKAISDIQTRLGPRRRLLYMKRVEKFLEAMAQLDQVVNVYLNVDRMVAFIWVSRRGPNVKYTHGRLWVDARSTPRALSSLFLWYVIQ